MTDRRRAIELLRKIDLAARDAQNPGVSRVTVDTLLREIRDWATEAAQLLAEDLDPPPRRVKDSPQAAGDA